MLILRLCVHLATELILHRKVNKADTSGDQGIDEPHCVQPRLELGRYHAHEDLPAEGLNTVLTLQTLAYPLCRHDGERQRKENEKGCHYVMTLTRDLSVLY